VAASANAELRPIEKTFVVVMIALAAQAHVWVAVLAATWDPWDRSEIVKATPGFVIATTAAFGAILTAMAVATAQRRKPIQIALVVAIVATIVHLVVVIASAEVPHYYTPVLDWGVLLLVGGAFAVSIWGGSRPTVRRPWVPASQRNNPVAVAAAIVGVTGPVSIWLGCVALGQIWRSGEGGRGLAILGNVLGVVWIVFPGLGYMVSTAKPLGW